MQGRVGPPLLQPFYDVGKLLEKEHVVVALSQNFFVLGYLVFILFAGRSSSRAATCCSWSSPSRSRTSSSCSARTRRRALLRRRGRARARPADGVRADGDPRRRRLLHRDGLVLRDATSPRSRAPLIVLLPGLFLGFFYVLTMKLRKSPFDISTSHHAHQEIVKGVTTEFSGSTLGMIEIAHWYETVFLLGLFWLFFAWSPLVAVDRARAHLPRRDLHRQRDRARQVGLCPAEHLARDPRPLDGEPRPSSSTSEAVR